MLATKQLGRLVLECGALSDVPHLGIVFYRLRNGGHCFYLDLYGAYVGWTWYKK